MLLTSDFISKFGIERSEELSGMFDRFLEQTNVICPPSDTIKIKSLSFSVLVDGAECEVTAMLTPREKH